MKPEQVNLKDSPFPIEVLHSMLEFAAIRQENTYMWYVDNNILSDWCQDTKINKNKAIKMVDTLVEKEMAEKIITQKTIISKHKTNVIKEIDYRINKLAINYLKLQRKITRDNKKKKELEKKKFNNQNMEKHILQLNDNCKTVLYYLSTVQKDSGKLSQNDITQAIAAPPGTVSKVLKELQEKDMVEKIYSEAKNLVYADSGNRYILTQKAYKIYTKLSNEKDLKSFVMSEN